jgi:prepilin-type N-terminal cleavage/methylation domain-containing protein
MTARRGMTLIELVVGLTVTGMATAAGYGIFAALVDQRDRVEQQINTVSRSAAARRMLVTWIQGARLTIEESGPPFRGMDGVYEHVPDDELSFLTTAPTPIEARETVVRLYVDHDRLTPEQGLTAELSAWPAARVERVEIEPHAAGLNFRYFTRMLGSSEWLPSWISSTVLPAGVELTLSAGTHDTLPSLLRFPIVLPVGNDR